MCSESPINWSEIAGMSETQAEAHMLHTWGRIPNSWNDPLYRDQVTQIQGQAEIEAHMNFGEQAYGDASRLGDDARAVWDERNIRNQGHPAEDVWRSANSQNHQ